MNELMSKIVSGNGKFCTETKHVVLRFGALGQIPFWISNQGRPLWAGDILPETSGMEEPATRKGQSVQVEVWGTRSGVWSQQRCERREALA